MSTIMSVVIVALISSLFVSFLPQTQAYGPLNHACCVKYTRNPLPFGLIKGYIEQSSREVCRIDAIIFFTKHNKKVCASVKDEWVRATLARLSTRINQITRPRSQPHLNTPRMDNMPYTSSPQF